MARIYRCADCKREIRVMQTSLPNHSVCARCRQKRLPQRSHHLWRAILYMVRRDTEGEIQDREGVMLMPEDHAVLVAKFPERVAAIVGKTFEVIGADAFGRGLADDEALALIRNLLNEIDPDLIERNKHKSLSRLKRAS
jgi:DNA-directed RNA polymerase subunit RPC12/RpoP